MDLAELLEGAIRIGLVVIGQDQRPGVLLGISSDVASDRRRGRRRDARVLAYILIVDRAVGPDVILLRIAEIDALYDFGIDPALRCIHVTFHGEAAIRLQRQRSPHDRRKRRNVLGDHWIGLADGVGGYGAGYLTGTRVLVEQ